MKKKILILILLLICTLLVPSVIIKASENEVIIFYTNDIHTYIDKDITYSKLATLKSLYSNSLLLDAGDHIQGTAYGSMDKGETVIKLMNSVGYDGATLGNHEFDYGMERCLEVASNANFSYLSCNFHNENNGNIEESVLDTYRIYTVNGIKIGVIGITTPETIKSSTPAYFQDEKGNYIYGISGGDDGSALYSAVQETIDTVKQEVDFVIALGHLGIDEASFPYRSIDVINNTVGLDAFIDGHSHSTVEMMKVNDKNNNKVILTQTGEYFDRVGKMTLSNGNIKTELLTSEYFADIESNEDVKKIEDEWISEIDNKLGEVIGKSNITLNNYDGENRLVRKEETNTGDFASDALYYLFDNMGMDVDVAIMNGGGIRNKEISGDLTYKTCKEIHTFGNVACLIKVTGKQILDALEWGASEAGISENGGFLQVSGVTYEIDTNISPNVLKDEKGVWTGSNNENYRVHNVKIYNKEKNSWDDLDLNSSYNLAGYNYTLRDLGDGFAMFNGAINVLDYVMEDYMVLANYIKGFENGIVGGSNSPLLKKYSNLKIDYNNVSGSGRIGFSEINSSKNDSNYNSHLWIYLVMGGVVIAISSIIIYKKKKENCA